MSIMTFAAFVTMTTSHCPEQAEFIPMMVNPISREVRGLANVPDDVDLSAATREWAAEAGGEHYFIAYPLESAIVAEEYRESKLVATQTIDCN